MLSLKLWQSQITNIDPWEINKGTIKDDIAALIKQIIMVMDIPPRVFDLKPLS